MEVGLRGVVQIVVEVGLVGRRGGEEGGAGEEGIGVFLFREREGEDGDGGARGVGSAGAGVAEAAVAGLAVGEEFQRLSMGVSQELV